MLFNLARLFTILCFFANTKEDKVSVFIVTVVNILPADYENKIKTFPVSLTYATQEDWFIITVTGTGTQRVRAIDYSIVAGAATKHQGEYSL